MTRLPALEGLWWVTLALCLTCCCSRPTGAPPSNATTTRIAVPPANGALPVVDSPPWPGGETGVRLTWKAPAPEPDPAHPDMEALLRRDLELVVGVGAIERRLILAASGPLLPEHQRPCRAALPADFSELRRPADLAFVQFGRGSFGGFLVRRATPTTLLVETWSWDDGGCPDAQGDTSPCPVGTVGLARIPVPANANFEEQLLYQDRDQRTRDFACDGSTL
jgi:hypothetical protein